MKNTSTQISRKAPQGREGRDSTTASNTSTAAKSTPRYELIKLGVDTHASQYTFARMIDGLAPQPVQKLAPDAFLEFLQKQRALARRVVMVYEAGPYGFSLQRQASAVGVECLVCAPERLSRGRKRVNDKIDGKELLSRLDRHLAGNQTALRLVRVPSIEEEMSRRQARERNTYRKDRQRWIARGRSDLHSLGIARPGRWWELDRHGELLKILRSRYGEAVTDQTAQKLGRYVEIIQMMQKRLEEMTALLETAAKEKRKETKEPRIKGIGHLSDALLDREMCDWRRFGNRRQVASYTGLCPGEDSSGDSQRSLSIDKHGNPRVRAVLVELAWLLPRFQPQYKALQRWKWVFEPGSKAGAAMRKKAVVALARRLAVDLWRIKTGRAKAADLGLTLVA